jgi:SpoVK/Ycf46/Vps4 family AAA+-type ATPase
MAGDYYATSVQHILAELERIDLLIRVQVMRARQLHQMDSEFQGLYIPEEEVDQILAEPAGMPNWASAPNLSSHTDIRSVLERHSAEIERRKAASKGRGVTLRFDQICHLFDLNLFEAEALLICLAPEIDLRYERLFAYLQDDVTKKRPSVDLVLNMLSPSFEAKLSARKHFDVQASLRKHHLVDLFDDPSHQQPPLLSKYIKIDDRVVNYLHDSDELDARLLPCAQLVNVEARLKELMLPADVKRILTQTGKKQVNTQQGVIFYFQGPYGVGKQTAAEALCDELGMGLVSVNLERLAANERLDFDTALRLVQREALLQRAAIYWSRFDTLLLDDRRPLLREFMLTLEGAATITFVAGEITWEPMNALYAIPFLRIKFAQPGYSERVQLWQRFLDGSAPLGENLDLGALANKFRFSGGQICDAVATAKNLARKRDPQNGFLREADLYAACRLQSNRKLVELAQKITPNYSWDDIVLPADRLQQLREICNYVKYRSLVYDQWGFDRKLSLGKGLNVLFAGPSGTGKTMAAEIMAGELGLDLYKIDLSTVVSKYIGETEKNLSKIFREAETSNAILFFDEADALFGRRSEIRDSHDRYANIEISYLLQKMEEYEGVVILATNLRKNMDDAFVRRMHFTVEFPFPNEKDRRRIWEKIWPAEVPRSLNLDLDVMAHQHEIAGGNIRNIALAAAFLAASDDEIVDMTHLIRATRREYQKMGKVVTEGEFGKYSRL